MRKELLKHYILALVAEGHFAASDRPTLILQKVLEFVKADVPAVLKDLATVAVAHGVRTVADRASATIKTKLEDVAADIGRRGIDAIWGDLMAAYNRGAEVKAK